MKRAHQHSQVFLRNPKLVAELIGHTNINKQDTVLDIGAGSGIITATLANRVSRVISIESEPNAATKLLANAAALSNVAVVQKDFLQYQLPKTDYKVFSNIPFHLSSPIVRVLTDAPVPPKAIYLIVQKQFANKLLADNRHFTSQLGAQLAPWWSVRIRRPLKKTDFWPHPAVDTVLLELEPRTEPLLPMAEAARFKAFINIMFENPIIYKKQPLAKVGINPELSPSQLTGEQWVDLYLLA